MTPNPPWNGSPRGRRLALAAVAAVAAGVLAAAAAGAWRLAFSPPAITVGLITKTEDNPFFVSMREGALSSARAKGVRLLTAAGKADGDYESQIEAIRTMVAKGATTILVTPSDAHELVPAIREARQANVMVIALDGPTDPEDATDALFATDNYKAGELIGRYARAAIGARTPRIVMLDLFPGHPVGARRHNGFLKGFGLEAPDGASNALGTAPEIVCAGDSFGDRAKGRAAMEACLKRSPDVNLVYTINEQAAEGAHEALKAAGREKDAMVVSIDGGCAGVRAVREGRIAATSQQYPNNMAILGVDAGADYARTGKKANGYVDTGLTLIAREELRGVESRDPAYGQIGCW